MSKIIGMGFLVLLISAIPCLIIWILLEVHYFEPRRKKWRSEETAHMKSTHHWQGESCMFCCLSLYRFGYLAGELPTKDLDKLRCTQVERWSDDKIDRITRRHAIP